MYDYIIKLTKEYERIILVDGVNSTSLADSIMAYIKKNNYDLRVVVLLAGDFEDFTTLFKIYEFSDKIKLFGRNKQYGGLMNLVDTGLWTEEQVFEAILH